MKIPYDFSIEDWVERFRQLFEIVAHFLKEAFNFDLFTAEDQLGKSDEGASEG